MNAILVRRLLFVSSWSFSLIVGLLIVGMTALCRICNSIYLRVLGDKPLPRITEFYVDFHSKPFGLILVLIGVATLAFLLHLAASRAPDPTSGILIWITLVLVVSLAIAAYLVVGMLSVLLPFCPITGGMKLVTPEEASARRFSEYVHLALFLGTLLYVAILGALMWKRHPAWTRSV